MPVALVCGKAFGTTGSLLPESVLELLAVCGPNGRSPDGSVPFAGSVSTFPLPDDVLLGAFAPVAALLVVFEATGPLADDGSDVAGAVAPPPLVGSGCNLGVEFATGLVFPPCRERTSIPVARRMASCCCGVCH